MSNQEQRVSSNETANIKYNVYGQPLPFVGKTVAEARAALGQSWQVPSDATAKMGKQDLADDYVIQAGDSIQFHKRHGEKG